VDDWQSEMHALAVDSRAQASGGVHDKRALTTIDNEGKLRKDNAGANQGTTDLLHSIESSLHFVYF
jgi:hypothetical protein